MKKILFLGPKPPPVSGYANIVSALAETLAKKEVIVWYFSTVPSFFTQFFPGFFWKILRVTYLLLIFPVILITIPFSSMLYLNMNGGLAQAFDSMIVLIARLCNKSIVIHHNSFAYLNKSSFLTKFLFILAGKKSLHIVNCNEMKKTLLNKYAQVENVEVISNVSILSSVNPKQFGADNDYLMKLEAKAERKALVLGFMGYFNKEKGLDTFCLAVKKLHDSGVMVIGIAVGPIHDAALLKHLKLEYSDLIDFRGPVYGLDRDDFFAEIDLLLFPSRYSSEAEPLTIHHALSQGVPVISTDVGCLKSVVKNFRNSCSFPNDSFVSSANEFILENFPKTGIERLEHKKLLIIDYQKWSTERVLSFESILNKMGVV